MSAEAGFPQPNAPGSVPAPRLRIRAAAASFSAHSGFRRTIKLGFSLSSERMSRETVQGIMSTARIVFTVGALALTAVAADAAPLPSPWQREQALELPIEAPDQLSADALQMTEEFVFLGVPGAPAGGGCGEVWIYSTDALLGREQVEPEWVLAPADKASCIRDEAVLEHVPFRAIFGANLHYSGERLIIADTGVEPPGPAAGEQIGSIRVYRPVRDGDSVVDWELAHTIDQASHGLATIGTDVATDGENIFTLELELPDWCFDGEPGVCEPAPVVSIPWIVNNGNEPRLNGRIQSTNVNFDPEEHAAIDLAGDQLVLNAVQNAPLHTAFMELFNLNEGEGDWKSSQLIPVNTQIPGISDRRVFGVASSGDSMAGFGTLGCLLNCAEPGLVTLARGRSDQWSHNQLVANPEGARLFFGSLPGNVEHRLRGADLIVGWGFPPNADPAVDAGYRLLHYRLNADNQFERLQTIDAFPYMGMSDQPLTEPIYALGDRRLLALTERINGGLELVEYRRAQRDTLAITRGITGGWSFGPGHDGQGAFLQVIGGSDGPRVLMLWATHDSRGEQMWLRGVGRIDVDRVRMDLARTGGARFGAAFAPADVEQETWGEARLVFDSCDTGTLHYDSEVLGSGELPLRRVTGIEGLDCGDALGTEAAQRWTGSWYDPARSGEGFVLQLADTRGAPVLTSVWATYNQREQMWLYGDARLTPPSDDLDVGDVVQPVGLPFSGDTDNGVMRLPWGRHRFSRLGCDTIGFSYESDVAGFGSGMHVLQRLTTPLGLDCPGE